MPYNYFNNYANQYTPNYNPYMQQRVPDIQYNRPAGLQGRVVDNIDVVKSIEIPLDGSTSYFALADGSAIVTKQLQQDGKSKTIIYVPATEEKQAENKYITENDLKAQFGEFSSKDIKDIRDELKSLKKQIRDITDDIADKKEA
jgi:hypothetical protein